MLVREWAWIAYYVELVFSMRAMMGIKLRLRFVCCFHRNRQAKSLLVELCAH